MNRPHAYSIAEINRLRDRAHVEAERLRQQALQDFWRGADQLVESTASSIERSAQRFGNRLRRHLAKPVAPCGSGTRS